MSASFFDRNRSGSIVSRLISDVSLMQNLVGNALTNVWMDSAAIIVVLYFLFRIDVSVTFIISTFSALYHRFFAIFRIKFGWLPTRFKRGLRSWPGNTQERIAGSHVVHTLLIRSTVKGVILKGIPTNSYRPTVAFALSWGRCWDYQHFDAGVRRC
ncbi:MAG: ABC transporter transmembrane domain-containing protein [Deinococcales bacterium]